MPSKTDAVVARTIGIDTGKNTLHLIGLDEKGAIVLREKVSRGRIVARLANAPRCPDWHRGRNGDTLCCP
jgi:transposase